MFVLLVILFLLLLLVTYVLFAPFYVEINSRTGVYRVRFHHVASVQLNLNGEIPLLETNILGRVKNLSLSEQTKPVEQKPELKRVNTGKKKKQFISPKKIRGVLRSFRVKTCFITFDTGDSAINGWLYPLVEMAAYYSKKNISINFLQKNEVVIELENNLARMSWAYISS